MRPQDVPQDAVREILPILQRAFASKEQRDRLVREALARAHPLMVRAAVLGNFATPAPTLVPVPPPGVTSSQPQVESYHQDSDHARRPDPAEPYHQEPW